MSGRAFSYFPGCSLECSNRAYDASTRNVAAVLGIQMPELEDWNCCGATAYFGVDEARAGVMAARNLALAEARGHDLVTVCSGCYLALGKTNHRLAEDADLRRDVQQALRAGGMDYRGTVTVRHFLDVVVRDVGEEAVRRHVVRPLQGLPVACYHGCQLSRPHGEIDDPEFPDVMDRLVGWLGAAPAPFPLKTRCCGGMLMTTQPGLGREMTGKLLLAAKAGGAHCVATACPLCQVNLEAYQRAIGRERGEDCRIPVLYFTQLMGWAFGLGSGDLRLEEALTPARELLAGLGATP
ncbi:MAG: disulfide reductase [Planctomycetes bacterium]|nr:disulfide reductase [Planctomycetota bacterium]